VPARRATHAGEATRTAEPHCFGSALHPTAQRDDDVVMSGQASVRLPGRDVVFDGAVLAVGLVVAALSAIAWLPVAPQRLSVAVVVAALAVPVIGRYPFVLTQKSGDSNIGLDPAVLVFLVLTCPAAAALTLWSAGQLLAQLTNRRSLRVRLFNFGITVCSGGLLVLIAQGPVHSRPSSPDELGLILLGCAAYFVVDIYVTAWSLALETRTPLRESLSARSMPVALLVCLGIDIVGYLAVLMHRGLPGWTLALLLVPAVTIAVSVRSISGSQLTHDQLMGLLDATAKAPDWANAERMETALIFHAERIVRLARAEVRPERPGPGEIGSQVRLDGQPAQWLVCRRRANAETFSAEDHQALDALTAVAASMASRRRLADEMAFRAKHDLLTGLANRATFSDRLEHALQRRVREPGAQLAVLYVDLDGFKLVNDRLGHHAGDQVLISVAERIRSCLRPSDTAARLGGDEFAILIEDLPTANVAELAAERILASLREPVLLDGRPASVRASIGLAYPDHGATSAELLRLADGAMYRAKTSGRDRYTTFHYGRGSDGVDRLQLEDRLRQAIADRVIRPYFQPIVDLTDGAIYGFEALARWDDPVLGRVAPDVFIPVAEQLDLIDELGRHMLASAHRVAVLLQQAGHSHYGMSVNLAPSQVFDATLLDLAEQLRREHPSVALTLEVTERTMLGNDQDTLAALARLRSSGVRLAIDDFGVGYSSIGYLRRFAVDMLKIDQSFVRVVAEGVETPEQAAVLRRLGCRYAQGYLFARPVDAQEALRLARIGRFLIDPLAPVELPAVSG